MIAHLFVAVGYVNGALAAVQLHDGNLALAFWFLLVGVASAVAGELVRLR